MAKILVVDDDAISSKLIVEALSVDGHLVDFLASAALVLSQVRSVPYDLIVLDWMLLDGNGPEICHELRANGHVMPVLFLTGRTSIKDKQAGYNAGADDYLTKPFEPDELRMKVRAILRRPQNIRATEIRMRNLVLNTGTHQIFKNEVEIHLLPKEYALLEFLMTHPKQVFNVDALLNRVWRTDATAAADTVRVTLMRIRQKVEHDFDEPLISTIRGFGYRLDP